MRVSNFLPLFLFFNISLYAQDVIIKKSNEEILSKVIEVTTNEVRYKKYDNLNGPTFNIEKSEIYLIKFENGTTESFAKTEKDIPTVVMDTKEMFSKGKEDALLNYDANGTGAGWTAVTTALFSPIIGLIPAIATSTSTPRRKNLNMPDRELFKNIAYKNGYTQNAHKMKRKKIWTGFGIGTGVWGVLILLSQNQQQ